MITSIPSPAIASTVIKIDNVNYAIKSLIANHIDEFCKKLCIKTNGTILYNTDYDSMAEFDFKMLFNEIKTHNPFLIDMLNSVSAQHTAFSLISAPTPRQ